MDNRLRRSSLWAQAAYIALVLAALAPTTSCSRQGTARQMTAAESAQAVQALTTWLECEECQDGELAAVTRYGQTVVPSLIAVLDGGPSPASREQMRRQLEVRYDELAERAQRNPNARLASSKDQFIALYLGNFDAQYRVRAAQALAAIGGQRSRGALEAALGKAQRGDVDSEIRRLLRTMK